MSKEKSVAFLGPEASFSSIAASAIFGNSVSRRPQKSIHDVFSSVEKDESDFGVVPIENSTEGSVTVTLDEFIGTTLNIMEERDVRISLNLLSKSGDMGTIKKVYSHPQSMGQCRDWLNINLPSAETIIVASTTSAALFAADDPEAAAVASIKAAETYGLKTVAKNIEDLKNNYTRFFVISKLPAALPTGNDKTSIVCTVKDKPAALLSLLKPFADYGINMKKIESRPDRKKIWEYNFFIDFLGHRDDLPVSAALEKMREETVFFKILGSYPVDIKKTITVAVDGPAGSGKSTVCKRTALLKSLKYIDSGAIYRSVTWHCLEKKKDLGGMDFKDELNDLDIKQVFTGSGACLTFVNGQDVSSLIRDETILNNIGTVSDNPDVRDFVNTLLRKWAESESVIMDGRDIGTVVFPDADIKIYLDASVDIRTSRRIKEYRDMGKKVDENSIKKQIIQRDEQDLSRKYGALAKAEDALYCDTSSMTQDEVVAHIIEIIDRAS
ncbi:MAG: prephenate dehydratase [Spirochaetia bacterium]|jgi:chorismate mutase/prephenate dehydratase|nr:prephenate dehydratase [Spirochaetia bacterium]